MKLSLQSTWLGAPRTNASDTEGSLLDTQGTLYHKSKLASLQLEIPEGVKEVYLTNRERDDLPPSIVRNATWEYFPLPRRPSYWIQYTETFGSSIKFINDYWYNISWSKTFNSYYTESDQLIEEATDIGLGSLDEFLRT
jgi:hypothetical protein